MQFRANGLPDWASLDTGDGDKTLMRQKHVDANSKLSPTNAVFATVNQMFSGSSQLPTAAEHCFVIWTVLNDLITACSTVGQKLGGVAEHLIDGSEKRICQLSFEC